MLHILLRALRRTLHDCSPGAGPEAKFGAVSFLHRFGASLNPHFHYHLCVLDGVYEAADEGFSLDASVRIAAHDRAGLERLLRYCARIRERRIRPDKGIAPGTGCRLREASCVQKG